MRPMSYTSMVPYWNRASATDLTGPELQVDAGDLLRHLDGVLHAGHIAHHQRAAAVVHAPVRQSLNGDLWAVAEGISHGDAENRKIHCIPAFYVFSTFLC